MSQKNYTPPSIAIVGIGGAGFNRVQRHQEYACGGPRIQYLAVNTDRQAISRIHGMPTILLNSDGSGVEAVMPWLASCNALYVMAGLGGVAGSTAAPALVHLAQLAGIPTVALVSLPADFEGRSHRDTAERALQRIRMQAAETVIIDGEEVVQRLGDEISVSDFLDSIDKGLLEELDTRLKAGAGLMR